MSGSRLCLLCLAMSTPTLLCTSQSGVAVGLKHEHEQHRANVCHHGTYPKSNINKINKAGVQNNRHNQRSFVKPDNSIKQTNTDISCY